MQAIPVLFILLLGTFLLQAQTPVPVMLSVDASHAPDKTIHVRMGMRVHAGPLTLYYPKWIPGMHEPAGPIANVTGLQFRANGQSIPWRRDLLDVFTFHVEVPAGVEILNIAFDYMEPIGVSGPTDGMASDKLLVLNWNQVLLYPAGVAASQLSYRAELQLPSAWRYGTALHASPSQETQRAEGPIEFEPVPLTRLIDSPLIAGEYYRSIDLTPPGELVHHEIDMVADSEAALAMPVDLQKGLTSVVAESGKLFGSRHYGEYHFLLTLSDQTAHFGVEHHESNDSRLAERALILPGAARDGGALLAHEFAHSWCGKFRRPEGEDVPDYQTPMKTDLLWVYEGNTSFFGDLLATRSGLWTPQDYRDAMASYAASLGPGRPGRTWRSVVDTAVAVPGMFHESGWLNWRRGSDYYEEGELIWLEVAAVIHDQSHGKKSFDDFARLFYGGSGHGPEMKPYTFDEVVQNLNTVAPYQWAEFLNERLHSTSSQAPIGGLTESGWNLVFTSEPLPEGRISRSATNTTYALGLTLRPDGTVLDVLYNGEAFKAGITPGMKVAGVNSRVYSSDVLSDVMKSGNQHSQSIELLLVNNGYYRTCKLPYQGGEKYPHLTRNEARPDYLTQLLKSQTVSSDLPH